MPSVVFALLLRAGPASAQQRPLVTEDPEPIGAGRVLIEGGLDFAHDQRVSGVGLRGNLWRVPTSASASASARSRSSRSTAASTTACRSPAASDAPLVVAADGHRRQHARRSKTSSIAHQDPAGRKPPSRPAFGFRFATKLPNASNESGLGLDTTDFSGVAARRQDRPVDPRRRQPRLRHPGRSDATAIGRTTC